MQATRPFRVLPVLVAALGGCRQASGVRSAFSVQLGYETFRRDVSPRVDDPVSYDARAAIFEQRLAEIAAHNARPDTSWVAGVNRFADYLDSEREALLGYRRVDSWWRRGRAAAMSSSSLLEAKPQAQPMALADSVDWRNSLNRSRSFVRDQGNCGSCWAAAAAGALEMHAELAGATRPLSFVQLVECVPNPKHCGGAGGCQGATAELAFQYVREHGISDAQVYDDHEDYSSACLTDKVPSTRIGGWTRLPENQMRPLMEALTSAGPVTVSVDASKWYNFVSGVFDECGPDAIVNHAVLALGYGADAGLGKKYWLIRNSWGPSWGEQGHLRLLRLDVDIGAEGYCGVDRKPEEGVGCDGGPKEIPVCGMCGVLSDSSYPTDVRTI